MVTGRANSPNNGNGAPNGNGFPESGAMKASTSVSRCVCDGDENERRSVLFEAGSEKRETDVTFREGAEVQLQV